MSEWVQISCCDAGYLVTTEGNFSSPKFEYQIRKTGDYVIVGVKINGQYKAKSLHTLIAKTFIPNPDSKPFVNHKDRNRANNNVSNLEWVTAKENQIHWNQMRKIEYESFEIGKPVQVIRTKETGVVVGNYGKYIDVGLIGGFINAFIYKELTIL